MTYALVPVKRLSASKARLRNVLEERQRADVTLAMLRNVIGAIQGSGAAERVYVVTPDEEVATCASVTGAIPLAERRPGLNAALEGAREEVGAGAQTCLVMLGDLPLLTASDVAGLLTQACERGTVVLAPDRHGTGTNGLVLRPGNALPFLFGVGSRGAYRDAARDAGLTVRTYRSPGTAWDLDMRADLQQLVARGWLSERAGLRAATTDDSPRE